MKKKTIAVSMCFALVSLVALAQAAFAAPPGKTDSSQHGGVQEKAKKSGSSSSSQDGGSKGHKVTICHNGHLISVAQSALPAHQRHGDGKPVDEPTAIEGEDCSVDTELQPKEGMEPPSPPEVVETMTLEDSTEETTTGAQSEGEKVKTCDDGKSIELKEDEKRTLELHNETRKENGLKPLCVDPTLTKAARAHSKEMVEKGYFGHSSRNGETSGERLKRYGYAWRASGENLARGSGSLSKPEDRFKAWMKSVGHRKNILDKNFREVGVGVATIDSKKGGKKQAVYTVDFGSRQR